MATSNCLVLKFGGASVKTPASFCKIAAIIASRKEQHSQLVVVVSAMGKTTDKLLKLAGQVHPTPPKRELDMLLTVGERISISLLAMSLDKIGLKAQSFTGSQSGIITDSNHNDAVILEIKPQRIQECLSQGSIAIVAGFQGVSQGKEITTLGRGGSDTSAVAIAAALDAKQVEFYKDVEGVYQQDPKLHPQALHLPFLTYNQALQLIKEDNGVLHRDCIQLASQKKLPIKVVSYKNQRQFTWICKDKAHMPVEREVLI